MSDQVPRCAVVIPTYNCAPYLALALASVAAQGVMGLEVIVVDDGSTDETDSVLLDARTVGGLGRLTVIRTAQVGPSKARNQAVAITRAPLIAFLDADDVWLPGTLQRQIDFHEAHPDVVLSFTDYRHVGENGEDRGTCFEYWHHRAEEPFNILPNAASLLLGQNLVGTSFSVARKEALQEVGGFCLSIQSSEDWDLWLKLARLGPVARSGMVGGHYLMRSNSLTAARAKRIAAMETILRRARNATPAPAKRDVRRARARIMIGRAEHDRETGRPFRAALGHAAALALDPSRRTLRAMIADVVRTAGFRS